MADTLAVASAPASPKKTAAKANKKPRAKPTHPKTSAMVNAAIKSLKEKSGSSLQAIKKYITGTYKVDAEKLSPFIKKYLKSAVTSGELVQTKGKGAAGSFKLPVKDAKPAKAAVKKPVAKLAKKTTVKKAAASPKKAAAAKKSVKKVTKPLAAKKSAPATVKPKVAKPAAAKKPKAAAPKKKATTTKKAPTVAVKAKKPVPKKAASPKKK